MKLLPLTILMAIYQPAWAEIRDNFNGNINFTNNFAYRGIDRHSSNEAFFGNLEYASETGLYGGIWMGNYKTLWGHEADTETDLYVGYRQSDIRSHHRHVSLERDI